MTALGAVLLQLPLLTATPAWHTVHALTLRLATPIWLRREGTRKPLL